MTIVLVHGAWAGAWSWKETAKLLRQRGYDVYAPTLTGIAERSHVPPERVGLDTHIEDVAGLLRYEDLSDVLLVGHSYGGMVITGAADREPGRVKGMIYFDAFLPESGQALIDIVPPAQREAQIRNAEAFDGGKSIPRPTAGNPPPDPAFTAKFAHLFTPQPFRTMTEPFVTRRENPTWPPRHYILCAEYKTSTFQTIAPKVRNAPGWTYSELPALHDVVRTNPQMSADAIAEVAERMGIAKG